MTLDEVLWPAEEVEEAFDALLSQSTIAWQHGIVTLVEEELEASVQAVGRARRVDAQPVELLHHELGAFLRASGPALLCLTIHGTLRLLACVSARFGRVRIVAPGGVVAKVPWEELSREITGTMPLQGSPSGDELGRLLRLSEQSARRAADVMRAEALQNARVGRAWILRPPAHGPFRRMLSDAQVPRSLLIALSMTFGAACLEFGAYVGLGKSVLSGTQDPAFFLMWALALLSTVAATVLAYWYQSKAMWAFGQVLKRRLFEGALRLPLETFRHRGLGSVLGEVNEADSLVQGNAISVFLLLQAAVTIVLAAGLLGLGPAPAIQLTALVVCLALATKLTIDYFRASAKASECRTKLTQLTVDEMIGHDTRLVQQRPEYWHTAEDPPLAEHVTSHQQVDRHARLLAILPRIWMVIATLALVPSFLRTSAVLPLTAAIVGVLFAGQGFATLQGLVQTLGTSFAAWQRVRPVFDLGRDPDVEPQKVSASTQSESSIVAATDVVARYEGYERNALDHVTVEIRDRDRVLVEGPSGSGKTTLAAILSGLRPVSTGVLSVCGIDSRIIAPSLWRKAVAMSPQFHENHVFSDTVAFNLLLGREWPPGDKDLDLARRICLELGLGPLLSRMPHELNQPIGETGWRLSHGEQSRLFLARSLLQGSKIVVLDESFAALDPETLRTCIRCAVTRANSLVVVAHV